VFAILWIFQTQVLDCSGLIADSKTENDTYRRGPHIVLSWISRIPQAYLIDCSSSILDSRMEKNPYGTGFWRVFSLIH